MAKKKVNRKMKEKIFKQLKKHTYSGMRIDKWGRLIDFHQYGIKSDNGWLIVDGEAVNINTVRIVTSWEKLDDKSK